MHRAKKYILTLYVLSCYCLPGRVGCSVRVSCTRYCSRRVAESWKEMRSIGPYTCRRPAGKLAHCLSGFVKNRTIRRGRQLCSWRCAIVRLYRVLSFETRWRYRRTTADCISFHIRPIDHAISILRRVCSRGSSCLLHRRSWSFLPCRLPIEPIVTVCFWSSVSSTRRLLCFSYSSRRSFHTVRGWWYGGRPKITPAFGQWRWPIMWSWPGRCLLLTAGTDFSHLINVPCAAWSYWWCIVVYASLEDPRCPEVSWFVYVCSGIGTDPVLTAVVFHRCGELDWEKTAVKEGFVSFDFSTGKFYGLNEESVNCKRRSVRGMLTVFLPR